MPNKMQSLPDILRLIGRVVNLWEKGFYKFSFSDLVDYLIYISDSHQPQVRLQWVHGPNLAAEGRHGERVDANVGAEVEVYEIVLFVGAKVNEIREKT